MQTAYPTSFEPFSPGVVPRPERYTVPVGPAIKPPFPAPRVFLAIVSFPVRDGRRAAPGGNRSGEQRGLSGCRRVGRHSAPMLSLRVFFVRDQQCGQGGGRLENPAINRWVCLDVDRASGLCRRPEGLLGNSEVTVHLGARPIAQVNVKHVFRLMGDHCESIG